MAGGGAARVIAKLILASMEQYARTVTMADAMIVVATPMKSWFTPFYTVPGFREHHSSYNGD